MLVGTPSHKHLATCSIHAALRLVMQQCGKKEADGILSVIRDGNRVPPRCQMTRRTSAAKSLFPFLKNPPRFVECPMLHKIRFSSFF